MQKKFENMDGNKMKSDIELLIESQIWKRFSPKLKFRNSPDNERSYEKKNQQATVEKSISEFDKSISELDKSNSVIFQDLTEDCNSFNRNSPVQVPLFPKLPFGKHSEMAKGTSRFRVLNTNNEELMKIKLESGRIRRIINESSKKYSPKSGIVNSVRLNLKGYY